MAVCYVQPRIHACREAYHLRLLETHGTCLDIVYNQRYGTGIRTGLLREKGCGRACFTTICNDCDGERRHAVTVRSQTTIPPPNQKAVEPNAKTAWKSAHALSQLSEVDWRR